MIADIELEFEPRRVHLKSVEMTPQVVEMLYQDKLLGRHWIGTRALVALRMLLSARRQDDLDLLSMNAHLRRDLGLDRDLRMRK